MSSVTPIGPQPAPEMPLAMPETAPMAPMRTLGHVTGCARHLHLLERQAHQQQDGADDDEHLHRQADDVGLEERGHDRPQDRADDAADDERDDHRPRDVAEAHVGAGAEGHDEHLQEEREGSSEERVHAQQQQAGHEHAAVDTDRGQRGAGHQPPPARRRG